MGETGSDVVVVLLHGNHPRHVVKRHSAKAEVGVIRNLLDFFYEAVEIRRWNSIDSGNKIRRREAVLVRWGSATLISLAHVNIGQL
jgi:hypothetical protein